MALEEQRSDRNRRRRVYRIDRTAILRLLSDGAKFRIERGVPPDALVLGYHWDEASGGLLVSMQHDSWDPETVSELMRPPIIHEAFVRIEVQEPLPERAITLRELLATGESDS